MERKTNQRDKICSVRREVYFTDDRGQEHNVVEMADTHLINVIRHRRDQIKALRDERAIRSADVAGSIMTEKLITTLQDDVNVLWAELTSRHGREV